MPFEPYRNPLEQDYEAGKAKGRALIANGRWEGCLDILEDESRLLREDNLSPYQNGYADGCLDAIAEKRKVESKGGDSGP